MKAAIQKLISKYEAEIEEKNLRIKRHPNDYMEGANLKLEQVVAQLKDVLSSHPESTYKETLKKVRASGFTGTWIVTAKTDTLRRLLAGEIDAPTARSITLAA
jgi:uncharacterized protein YciW